MAVEVEFHAVVKGGAARQECQACKSGGQRRKGLEVVNMLFNLSKNTHGLTRVDTGWVGLGLGGVGGSF